jgi:protein-tyrosine phosphatase
MFHNLTLIPFDLPGKVYRTPLPYGDFDLARTTFDELVQAEVGVYYSLIEPIEWISRAFIDAREKLESAGIQRVEFPIRDFFAPEDPQAFQAVVAEAREHAHHGRNIAVHCYAGVGRTGLFLAELAIQHYGWNVREAVEWLRESLPLAVENDYQYQFLLETHSTE